MVDADGGHDGVLCQGQAVAEDRAQAQLGQVAGHELAEGRPGAGDEPAGHRGLGRPRPFHLTHRLQPHLVAAGRQPREHALGGHLGKEVLAGEGRPRGQGELLAGDGADPVPVNSGPASPEHNGGSLHRVTVRDPVRVVPALRTDQGGDVLLEQRGFSAARVSSPRGDVVPWPRRASFLLSPVSTTGRRTATSISTGSGATSRRRQDRGALVRRRLYRPHAATGHPLRARARWRLEARQATIQPVKCRAFAQHSGTRQRAAGGSPRRPLSIVDVSFADEGAGCR